MKHWLLATALVCFGGPALAGGIDPIGVPPLIAGAIDTAKLATDAVTPVKILSDAGGLTKVSGGNLSSDGTDLTASGTLNLTRTGIVNLSVGSGGAGAIRASTGNNLLVDGGGSGGNVILRYGGGLLNSLTADVNGVRVVLPTAQTIAAGNTVAADACGGLKQITSAGAVTTDTTNTFTAPAAANSNCCMDVVNTGTNAITLDVNANFASSGAADVVLGADDSVRVCSNGASGKWRQIGATGNN